MSIEDVYREAYLFPNTPSNIDIDYIKDMEAELKTAPSYKELSYKICPKYKEIYLAYAQKELMIMGSNGYNKNNELKINKRISQSLYRDGYSYDDLIAIIATSPSCNQSNASSPRLTAALQVIMAVNPIVNIPQLVAIADKKENISMSTMSMEELYYASLKKELHRTPGQSLAEADKKIVAILLHNEYDTDFIREVIKYSPTFNTEFYTLPQDDLERIAALQDIQKELDVFLTDAINHPDKLPIEDDYIPPALPIELTYEKMMEQIADIKRHQSSIDLFTYWKKSMDCFTDALVQSTKAKTICKILSTWSESINVAAKQINEPLSPDIEAVTELVKAYQETAQLEQNDWEAIYQIADAMSKFSTKLLNDTLEITKTNPLLKYPKVYTAVPFEELLRSHSHPAEMIYYSALRKAVLNNPGVGIYEADVKVKEILDTQKILTDKHKAAILSCSPRYRHVGGKQAQKIAAAGEWLKSLNSNNQDLSL